MAKNKQGAKAKVPKLTIPIKRGAGALLECEGRFLILQRAKHDSRGGEWGLPGGGIEPGESEKEAAVREIYEETGYRAEEKGLEFAWGYTVRASEGGFDFHFSVFRLRVEEIFEPRLDRAEHSVSRWVTPKECYRLQNLIRGFPELLERVYGIPGTKKARR
jgi:8-oxo-dGTP diphosphatase